CRKPETAATHNIKLAGQRGIYMKNGRARQLSASRQVTSPISQERQPRQSSNPALQTTVASTERRHLSSSAGQSTRRSPNFLDLGQICARVACYCQRRCLCTPAQGGIIP